MNHPDAPDDLARRRLLLALALSPLTGLPACAPQSAPVVGTPPPLGSDAALLDDLEDRTFRFFWETTNPANGLTPDRWPTPSFSSIAAVGFSLTACAVAVDRGALARDQARDRTLTALRFFRDAPQGPAARGMTGYRGFYYHFLDMQTGTRFADCELSTVDTAWLLAGALHAQSFFDGADAGETEIRAIVDLLVDRVDWRWAQVRAPSICLGWTPEAGFIPNDWKGYNEAMMVYLLALGAPSRPVAPDAWGAWTSTYAPQWQTFHGQTYLHFAPLFGHQYTHCWVDFRGLTEPALGAHGIDYFENSRRATLAQRSYAIDNPMGWAGYDGDIWGITACDGPADVQHLYRGELRRFITYAGRGAGGADTYDDGTIAPTACLSSLPFAPEIVLPALRALRTRHGERIYGRYGFVDAFNPSFDFSDVKVTQGRIVPGSGWVDTDYLGIDQGPIVAMVANHRRDAVWRTMRGNATIRRGLQAAGFTGGWLG